MNIPISKPIIDQADVADVAAVLWTGKLAQGEMVERFEQEFAAYHKARYGVAMSSGTAALVALMMGHGIGRGEPLKRELEVFVGAVECKRHPTVSKSYPVVTGASAMETLRIAHLFLQSAKEGRAVAP